MMRLLAVFFLVLAVLPVQAGAAVLSTELAYDRVDITTGFNGANVVVFGTTDVANPTLAIALHGPEKTVVVRRKGRVAGAWMNTSSMEFRRVPSYYDYALSISRQDAFPVSLMDDNAIGIEHLDFYPENPSADEQENAYFHDALIRSLQQKGFYPIKPSTVQFMQPQFFKVTFDLPPGVPTGVYRVDTILVQDGAVAAKQSQSFQVGQVGFNARVYLVATQNALLYAVVIILLAVASGWAAFTFLRRD